MQDIFDVNISQAFYLPSAGFASAGAFESAMSAAFPQAVQYDFEGKMTLPCAVDLQTAQRFLRGGSQTYDVSRFFLTQLRPDLEQAGFADWCAMAAYFPEAGVLSLSFHYTILNTTADRIIVLRQSGHAKKYPFPEGERSFTDLAEEICRAIRVDFAPAEQSFLCEVTRFGELEDPDQIQRDHGNLLYGFLTGDEGYAFVPEEIVQSRLCYQWGSRDFMRIYAFGRGFLFLNLLGSRRREEYLDRQRVFGAAAYGGTDPYFFMGSCPITANHGILFAVEFVMMLKSLIDSVIAFQSERRHASGTFYERIRATRDLRRKIIAVLEKVESTAISEIGELSSILLESQHIAPIIDRVKYLLELLEGDLDLMYSERNNVLVTILTVIGLIFAAIQIILPFFTA